MRCNYFATYSGLMGLDRRQLYLHSNGYRLARLPQQRDAVERAAERARA
jgi:hypothetical protein